MAGPQPPQKATEAATQAFGLQAAGAPGRLLSLQRPWTPALLHPVFPGVCTSQVSGLTSRT